ncbi:hypothetical protein TNCV_2764051 [Trichonephila clavipes]|nr:hypothetical protein TNCV_2764051 [Trichonephila clavipes]
MIWSLPHLFPFYQSQERTCNRSLFKVSPLPRSHYTFTSIHVFSGIQTQALRKTDNVTNHYLGGVLIAVSTFDAQFPPQIALTMRKLLEIYLADSIKAKQALKGSLTCHMVVIIFWCHGNLPTRAGVETANLGVQGQRQANYATQQITELTVLSEL